MALVEKPLLKELLPLSCSKATWRSPTPSGSQLLTVELVLSVPGKTVTRPKATTFMPFSGRNRSRTWPPAGT